MHGVTLWPKLWHPGQPADIIIQMYLTRSMPRSGGIVPLSARCDTLEEPAAIYPCSVATGLRTIRGGVYPWIQFTCASLRAARVEEVLVVRVAVLDCKVGVAADRYGTPRPRRGPPLGIQPIGWY